MALPTFLIVGTAKAGTTSLWNYLHQHPDIFMSHVKEPGFFAYHDECRRFEGPRDMERFNRSVIGDFTSYQELFSKSEMSIARGEASTMYLYVPGTANRINRMLPDAKIVAVLRNPADRAYSAYTHYVRDGVESESFEKAIELDQLGARDAWLPLWHYWKMGLYYRQVLGYYDVFGLERVQIYLYDDLKKNPQEMVRAIARFVGVRDDVPFDTVAHHNVGGIPRIRQLHEILTWSTPITRLTKYIVPPRLLYPNIERIKALNLTPAPRLPAETRRRLLHDYRDDIRRLADLIGRDLGHWLDEKPRSKRAA